MVFPGDGDFPYEDVVPLSTVIQYTGADWKIIGNMKIAPLAHRTFLSSNVLYHVSHKGKRITIENWTFVNSSLVFNNFVEIRHDHADLGMSSDTLWNQHYISARMIFPLPPVSPLTPFS